MGVEDVVIAGVQTPNCIRGTAWDAIALDYPRVTVLADATASASDQVQQANLYDMRQVSIATPTVAEWAAQLGAEAA
jgi:nicotinamidase-related amidase